MLRYREMNQKYNFVYIIIFCLILIVGVTSFLLLSAQIKPTLETGRSEMNKIPQDVLARLGQQKSQSTQIQNLRVPILLYHYVENVTDKKDTIRQSLNINPDIFELQIQTLQNAGYNFITARQLADAIENNLTLPPKPVLLTFDDGHWDLYTTVLPILQKYHVHATAYIVPGFLGGSDSLTQKQLQTVADSKLVEIGAHTVHHVSLKGKLTAVVKMEVIQSKQILEQICHLPVVSFAYPNGSFDEQAIAVVRQAGFTSAVSTIPGITQSQENLYFLSRLRPGSRTGQTLLDYLEKSQYYYAY